MASPRILFFGYSEVGHDCLSLLIERGDNVVGLITHEDSPGEKIWFKTPAAAAREKGIPIHTPEKAGAPESFERIVAMRPDLILSVYYRNMIGTKILGLAPLGAFNMHGSLLPKYRGRAAWRAPDRDDPAPHGEGARCRKHRGPGRRGHRPARHGRAGLPQGAS